MVKDVRLMGIECEALVQVAVGAEIVLALIKDPAEPVEGQQQQWSVFCLVRRHMVIDPAPFSDGGVDLPQALVRHAEIEMGLNEIRRQLNSSKIGLLRTAGCRLRWRAKHPD